MVFGGIDITKMLNTQPKKAVVHISIDDVGNSLKWLTDNRPISLFDMRLFGKMKQWHEFYGAKFTLYCFALIDSFLISEVPLRYAEDFNNASDWLKFGFHGKRGNCRFAEETGYEAGFELVDQTITRLGGGTTDILRLHSWQGTPEQKRFLAGKGIRTLLYPDDDGLGYDDTDVFHDCGLTHWRTRVWYEKIDSINEQSIFVGKQHIAAFTHEWCFDKEADKIEKSLAIYRYNGYEFI